MKDMPTLRIVQYIFACTIGHNMAIELHIYIS
jgi:hypothetical protein